MDVRERRRGSYAAPSCGGNALAASGPMPASAAGGRVLAFTSPHS
jgi:hypothetical protein